MRICVDIDGVIVEDAPYNEHHYQSPVRKEQVENLLRLQADHELVFYTSRPNQSYKETVALLQSLGFDTSNGVFFDKPYADTYIDDKMTDIILPNHAKLDRKKLVICYSGGMDSYIAYHYAIRELGYSPDDILCINFDIGHNYSEKEKQARESLDVPYVTIPVGLIQPDVFGNGTTKENYVIPARNLVFASIAAGFGERVWIVGIKPENHYLMFDKNAAFFRLATMAASQAVGAPTTIETPFLHMTKTEIIEWAMQHEDVRKGILNTVSCYHDTHKLCGNCHCVKRAIAMVAAGNFDELLDYAENPFTSEAAASFLKAYREADEKQDYSHYHKDRIDEVWAVYETMGINPDWVINQHYPKEA